MEKTQQLNFMITGLTIFIKRYRQITNPLPLRLRQFCCLRYTAIPFTFVCYCHVQFVVLMQFIQMEPELTNRFF